MKPVRTFVQTLAVVAVFAVGLNQAQAYSTYKTLSQTSDGQNMTFSFTGLPAVASGNVYVYVDLYGDYNSSNEYAQVWIDNVAQANHTGSTTQCNTTASRKIYTRPSSIVSDGKVTVRVDMSSYVSFTTCKSYLPRVRVYVIYTAKPDLRVLSSSVPYSGTTAKAGDTFKARYYLYNYYQYFSTNFYMRFYLCPTSSLTTKCIYQGAQYITDNFSASQGRWYTSPTLYLTNWAERGTRYLVFKADHYDTVKEAYETNNTRYDAISVTSYPDLDFTLSTVKYSGSTSGPGAKFTGRYTIKAAANQSAVFTDFVVKYYYCTSSSSTSCLSTPIGQETITKDFYSGMSYTYTSTTLTLPTSAKAGYRYVRAVLDATNKVTESSGSNNDDFDSIYVSTAQQPDLSVDQITAPYSGSTAAAGSSFTVRSRVRNVSANSLSTNFYVRYYLCPAKTTASCTTLAIQSVTNNLAANSYTYITSSTLKVPTSAKLGTSYLRVFVDSTDAVSEDSESNNDGYDAIVVTSKPDLSIAGKTVPKTGSTAGPGSTFTAEFTATNKANTSYFDKDFEVTYYYCTSMSTSGCVTLATDSVTNNFSAGEPYTFTSSSLTLPGTATAGTRYIRAFVDSKSEVAELSENNNNGYAKITVSKGPPDLYVKSLSGKDIGSAIKWDLEVCNSGEATTANFLVSVFYIASAAPSCSTTESDKVTITGGLAKGACIKKSFTQPGLTAGNYTTWVMADQSCIVNEGSENNNTKSAMVAVASPPDVGVPDGPEIAKDGGIDFKVLPPDQAVTPQQDQALTPDLGGTTGDKDAGATSDDQGGTVTPDQGGGSTGSDDDGGCSVAGTSGSRGAGLGLLLLALGLLIRRRRR